MFRTALKQNSYQHQTLLFLESLHFANIILYNLIKLSALSPSVNFIIWEVVGVIYKRQVCFII